jgi:hypothetical protein
MATGTIAAPLTTTSRRVRLPDGRELASASVLVIVRLQSGARIAAAADDAKQFKDVEWFPNMFLLLAVTLPSACTKSQRSSPEVRAFS